MTRFISLGFGCQTGYFINHLSADSRTMPFDWNITTKDFVLRELQNFDGKGFCRDVSELELYQTWISRRSGLGKDGILFWHEFPRVTDAPDPAQIHNNLSSKYNYLWQRFAKAVKGPEHKRFLIANSQFNLMEFSSSPRDFATKFGLDFEFYRRLRTRIESLEIQNYDITFLIRDIGDFLDLCNAGETPHLDARFVGFLNLNFHPVILSSLASADTNDAPIEQLYGAYEQGIQIVPAAFSSAIVLGADKRPFGVARTFSNGYCFCFSDGIDRVRRAVFEGNELRFSDKVRWTKVTARVASGDISLTPGTEENTRVSETGKHPGNSPQQYRRRLRCIVISPVGPGHQLLVEKAKASVLAAFHTSPGPFDEVSFMPMFDLKGEHGRSRRRNDGIKYALGCGFDWIFLLDADDLMAKDAFASVAPYAQDYDAVFGLIAQFPATTGEVTVTPNQLGRTTFLGDILRFDPELTLSMGHFVRTSAAAAIGFDEQMNAGEDFKYYLELWNRFRSVKLDRAISFRRLGCHSVGPRSTNEAERRITVAQVFEDFCRRHPSTLSFIWEGKRVNFMLGNPLDPIHRSLVGGRFFESEELTYLKQVIPPRATIVDVGANIGNNTVYYGLFVNPKKIIPIEPNRAAIALMKENIKLNQISTVDTSLLGCGVGDRYGRFDLKADGKSESGFARLTASEQGDVEVFPLDAKYRHRADFIKIDAGGMEMEVLHGAKHLIDTFRPILEIEVSDKTREPFSEWAKNGNYTVIRTFSYPYTQKLFAVPSNHPLASGASVAQTRG